MISTSLFVSIVVFILCVNDGADAQVCSFLSPCKCTFPNSTGFDLSSLNSADIEVAPSSPDVQYFFRPCPTELETKCPENYAFCKKQANNFTILGTVQNVAFGENATDGTSYIQYIYTKPNTSVMTTIMTLQCNDKSNVNIIEADHLVPGRLTLRSKASCLTQVSGDTPTPVVDEGISSGSVLVIMILVFGSLYFLGGMAILKFIRGASGVEIIPHYEFWSDLPFLVKDGIMFTVSGCQSVASYDRI